MSRSARQAGPAIVLALVLSAPASFRAQSTSTHTLTFAELSYGNSISGLARDASGGVWFAGQTCSATLPTTAGAFQRTAPTSPCNGMFGRMTADGAVTYLSYLGGSRESRANAIAIDSAGNVYVAGYTFATDFPTTAGAYDRTCGTDGTCMLNKLVGGHPMATATRDGFVTKLTPAANALIYSTYIGGRDDDNLVAIGVDGQGLVHVAGVTISTDFPVTAGALQTASNDGVDPDENPLGEAFYARLGADGSSLEYGTYLGGYGYDSASAIAVTAAGDAFVTGSTTSPNFPTLNPVQPQNASASYPWYSNPDAFVARFSSTGPVYSTYMGGSGYDTGGGIAVVDSSAYVAGRTCSTDFPGGGVAQGSCHSFVSELAASNSAVNRTILLQSTGGFDTATVLTVDANHIAYVGGAFTGYDSVSGSFSTTQDAYQRAYSAGWDAFFAIVDMSAEPSLVYSTLLGGGRDEGVAAVVLDGSGGAFFAGATGVANGARASGTAPFPSHTTNPEPPSEGASQSYLAHVGAAQAAAGGSPGEVVLYTHDATSIAGNWQLVADSTAAANARMWNPDAGVPKIATPAALPTSSFDLVFDAQAGVPYHLWLRLKADNDSYQNDSVFVQFNDSVDASGNPIWRTGSQNATVVSLEDCGGCGEQGWGWNDNGYGTAGTPVIFATSGTHTLRVQQREDGVSIDQIILSSATWATTAPGANKNDTTIVPQGGGTSNQPPTLTLTSPADDATLSEPATVTVSGTANDADGSVTNVSIYINGELKSSGQPTNGHFSATWSDLPAGMYTFSVVATDNQGASTTSPPLTIRVTGGSHLPAGWTDADVGATGAAGSAAYSNDSTGTYTVNGAGADVWGSEDAFHYAWFSLSGDGTVMARVASVSDEASWVKGGVMMRASLDPSSAQAFMFVSHAKGVCFQRRVSDGSTSASTCGSLSTAPHWVKLTRTGNTITGYESTDGQNWTMVGSDTFAMPNDLLAGLAVSSHIAGTPATATFDRVLVYQTISGGGQCGPLTLSQTSFYSGGPASGWTIAVTAPNDACTWTASIDQSWLGLNGAAGPTSIAGTGSRQVTLATSDNRTGAFRYGTFTIGGASYKVTQEPF